MTVNNSIPTQANTNLATFRIYSNGEQLPDEVGLSAVYVTKTVNSIPKATIELFDGSLAREDFSLSAGEFFKPGNEIEIKAGYRSIEDTIFKGILIKHGIEAKTDQPSKLRIELRDASVKMTIGRKNRYFEEMSDSEIIEDLLGGYGLEPDVEQTDITHKEMVQYYCTDWDYMLTRAEANGQLVLVNDGMITVKAPSFDEDPILKLHYGQNVFEFEADMDARDQYSATLGKTWDFINQEVTELEGSDSSPDAHGNISAADLAAVIGLDKWTMQHNGHLPAQELQAWTDAKLMRSRLAKIRGRVTIIGFTDVKPGHTIQLGGFGDRFNGKAFVSSIFHEFAPDKKWVTHIQFGLDPQWFSHKYDDILEKPASGLLPAIQGLHQGIVTDIDDPDGEGRVRVRIPVISTEETGIWARLATPDAGPERGIQFYPEPDDEVVVGFFNDDPRDPVILGGIHSSSKAPPYDVNEDNFEKGIKTRGELKLTFNDDLKSVTIETPNGNKVIISDDEGAILLEDENGNKAQLSSDGITLESASDLILKATGDVKIEGTNVEIAANAQFKAEGSAGAEVSTSGQAVLKGSIVQIN